MKYTIKGGEILTEAKLLNDDSFNKFINKFLIGKVKYAPVFSVYNVFELRPYEDIYIKFINVFSTIPCMMLFPYKLILEQEFSSYEQKRDFVMNGNVINAFSSLGIGDSYNLKKFLDRLWEDERTRKTILYEIDGLKSVAEYWNDSKLKFKEGFFNINLRKYYFENEKEALIMDLKNHGIKISHDIDIKKLPGLRVMEFSHFMRVYNRKKPISANDVMDVKMSCFIPYVDAVITENYQAELYKNMKSFIRPIENLEIYRLNFLKE